MVCDESLLHLRVHAPVHAADALHQAHRVPVDVVIDDPGGVLKVQAFGQDIGVSGEWSLTIDETSIVDNVLVDTYESESSLILINISHGSYGFFSNWSWRVSVHRVDGNWDSRLSLDIRRDGNGFGFGNIAGGTGYQEISTMSQTFFNGSRHLSLIHI